uniref:Uncharacterized protein n=1 Tax=Meloidogyne incognita TaxID=6306 RepID=A0A914ND89_MELIC
MRSDSTRSLLQENIIDLNQLADCPSHGVEIFNKLPVEFINLFGRYLLFAT